MTLDATVHRLGQITHYGTPKRILDTYRGQADGRLEIPVDERPSSREDTGWHHFARIATNDGKERYQRGLNLLDGVSDQCNVQLDNLTEEYARRVANAESKESQLAEAEREIEERTGFDSKPYQQNLEELARWETKLERLESELERPCQVAIPDFVYRANGTRIPCYFFLMAMLAITLAGVILLAGESPIAVHAAYQKPLTSHIWLKYMAVCVFGILQIYLAHFMGRWARRATHHPKRELGKTRRFLWAFLLAMATSLTLAYGVALVWEHGGLPGSVPNSGGHSGAPLLPIVSFDDWRWRLHSLVGWGLFFTVCTIVAIATIISVLGHDAHPHLELYQSNVAKHRYRQTTLERTRDAEIKALQAKFALEISTDKKETSWLEKQIRLVRHCADTIGKHRVDFLDLVTTLVQDRITTYEKSNRQYRTTNPPASFGSFDRTVLRQHILAASELSLPSENNHLGR